MSKLIELDKKIFEWLNRVVGKNVILDDIWKVVSVYFVYLVPIFLVILWFVYPKAREDSLRAAVVGILGWQLLTPLIAKIWFRARPIADTTLQSKELIFHRPTYSFPSDHALFLFALATGFYLSGHKEIGIGIYIVGGLVGFSRVVVGVHFLGDIIAGALIGVLLAWLAWRYREVLDPFLVKPFVAIARYFKLT